MFNRIPKFCLSVCIVVFGTFVISACTESNYQGEYVTDGKAELSSSNNESILVEYIIVLEGNISIGDATSILKKYEVQVIRNLKKGRYLIGLNNDPGIERLKKEIEGSEYIKQIQPNFSYSIQ